MRSTSPCCTSRSTRLVTAPDVTIVVPASSVGVSLYGAPARRRDASTSKSPLPSSACGEHRPQALVEQLGHPVDPADDEHRPDVELRALPGPLLGDAVHGVGLVGGHGLIISSTEGILLSMEDTSLRTLMVTAVAPIAWGTTYIVTENFLPPDRPLFAAAARALPAGLVLLAWRRQLPHGDWWWKAALLGLCNIGLFFPLIFLAAYELPGGLAATVQAMSPLAVMAIALPALGERPGVRRVVAALVGILGVGLLVLRAGGELRRSAWSRPSARSSSPPWGSCWSSGGPRRPTC